MVDRFVHGLLFGSGFSIALVAVLSITWLLFLPLGVLNTKRTSDTAETAASSKGLDSGNHILETELKDSLASTDINASEIPDSTTNADELTSTQFLGRLKIFSGGTRDNITDKRSSTGILSGGPGLIVGQVLANKAPVQGLKLKLTLNENLSSQWITTSQDGSYELSVPFGEYRVDGYELDKDSANNVLGGMIDHPQIVPLTGSVFEVRQGLNSRGPTFRFVDPVRIRFEKKQYFPSELIRIEWNAYPGAKLYTVQVYEKKDPLSARGQREIFSRSSRPSMTDTYIDLNTHSIDFKPGYFYTIEVIARDERINIISKTPEPNSGYDFEIAR